MKHRTIDMRGRACPEPVVATQDALKDPELLELTVMVDGDAAAENVSRMGRHLGCEVALETVSEREMRVVLTRTGAVAAAAATARRDAAACGVFGDTVVLIPTHSFGHGDPDLGRALLLSFINALKKVEPLPKTLIFLNGGAMLPCAGSEFVRPIKELEQSGVEVLVCGTCLDFFELEDKLEAGKVSNMLEIASALTAAGRIIRP